MSDPYDEGSNSVVIGVIRDLSKSVDESKQRLEQYENESKLDRAAFKTTIEDSLRLLRTDFQRALNPFLAEILDHREIHKLIIARAVVDDKDRSERQVVLNKWLLALTIGLIVIAVLVIAMFTVLVIRIVVVSRAT